MTAPGGLAPAVASFCAGDLTAEAFQREFERAELAVQRVRGASGSPAVAGVGPPGDGHVAVFTSLSALATYAGKCDWATASGADLFELVPEGYGIVVDPGGPCTAVLAGSAIRRGVLIAPSGNAR